MYHVMCPIMCHTPPILGVSSASSSNKPLSRTKRLLGIPSFQPLAVLGRGAFSKILLGKIMHVCFLGKDISWN